MSTFTDWVPGDYEVFCFLAHSWDVSAAKQILHQKPRESGTLFVADAAPLLGRNEDGSMSIKMGIWVDRDRLDEADLTVPVILVRFSGTFMVIDGWHRIARAERDGVKTLPCVCLNVRESKKVKVS